MPITSLVLATIAALLHLLFWVLESLTWRRPATWKRFGARTQEEADVIAPMAFNQGFYNLFLALGALVGVGLLIDERGEEWTLHAPLADTPTPLDRLADLTTGQTLVGFTMLCMVSAALVLVLSNRTMARAAAIQGGAPALALLIALVA